MSALPRVVTLGALLVLLSATRAAADPKRKPTAEPFDRQAAASALAEVNLTKCRATNAARGTGHVKITFAPSGNVEHAVIDKGPWVGTPVAKCLQKAFKKIRIPAFDGSAVHVGKTFELG